MNSTPLPTLFALALVAGVISPGLQAQESAREALKVLESRAGRAETANVVGIVGFNGQSQPQAWKFLVRDTRSDDFLREYVVQNQQLLGPTIIRRAQTPDLPTTPILINALRIDSTEAFRIADDTAIAAGIGFDRMSYQLRWRGNDAEPTWLATLVDVHGLVVANFRITAGTGEVAERDLMIAQPRSQQPPRSAPIVEVSPAPRAPVSKPAPTPRQTPNRPVLTPVSGLNQPPRAAVPSTNIWLGKSNNAKPKNTFQPRRATLFGPRNQLRSAPPANIPERYRP